jgi:ATP-binding cassette subfamily F protein 3
MSVDAIDIAEEIRNALPGTEEIIVQYLSGYLVDDAGEDEDTFQVTRDMLESAAAVGKGDAIDKLLTRLSDMLEVQIKARSQSRAPTLRKLGNVMDMSKAGTMSSTIAFSEGVDLESINKSKYVYTLQPYYSLFIFED